MTETQHAVERAQRAAERMDLEAALVTIAAADLDRHQRHAWQTTLRAIATHGQLESPATLLAEASTWTPDCAPIAAVLAGWIARLAAFTFDPGLARECASLHQRLDLERGHTELHSCEAQLWNAVWRAQVPSHLLELASQEVSEESRLCASHHALAGLLCWTKGERRLGLNHWRRASELARKSRSPHQQFLANIFLAKARRRFGQPHLSRRILTGMSVVSESQPAWSPWLEWEKAMLGDTATVGTQGPDSALRRALTACDQAEQDKLCEELHAALSLSEDWPLVREDIAAIATTFGVDDASLPTATVSDWQNGKSVDLPGSVKGLLLALSEPRRAARSDLDLSTAHFVLVPAKGPAKRIHARATPLFASLDRLDANELRDTKTLTLIAELALRGGQRPLEDIFEAVYGFPYQSARHQAIIDTLVYRGRKRLQDLAILERSEATLELIPSRAFLVADPRDEAGLVDKILSLIGAGTHTSAAELALALGVSNRTIQRTLKPLLEDGACVQRKSGKSVHYEVEDTTFHEPTEIVG